MIDLTKLSLNELKMIIKEYKNYISLKLIGLQKDDLIKLINKFNITLSNDDNKKIKKAIEKKEAKLNIPKVLTPAEKEAKEKKIERKRIEYKQRLAQRIKEDVEKEVEELKKAGRYEYDTPKTKKEKVEFNFTALYIPTKLKRDEYSKEQLNALYGDYEESFTDEKMNNIAKIMKENDKYKYVYDRFIEFVKYFKDVDIDKYINDLITYDFDFFEMPQAKRSRLPFFSSKIYLKTVNKTMSHDDYANYIKKAIEDIKSELKITKEPKVKETNNQDKIKELQDELKTLRVEYYAKFVAEETSRALTNKRKKWSGGESPQEYKQRYEKKQLLLKKMGIDTENLKSKTEWIKSQKEPKPKKEPKIKPPKEPKPPKPPKPPKEPKVKVIKEPKVKVVKEDNKKYFFTKQRRNEILSSRKNNPLIGDIINNNITQYEKLILPNNGRQLNNNIKIYYPKKYKLLTEYINNVVERNEKQQKMKKGVLRDTKINILSFIIHQIDQESGPRLFYPPYLQNYIALNGLYIVYRFFEILFKSINKNIIIIPKTNDEINKFENENYPYLKKLSLNEKTSIRTKYHNFLYDDYKVYDDFYLTYYSKN